MWRMSLFFVLFLLVAAGVSASGGSHTGTHLELIPAWGGHFRQDRYTEIGIRLRSQDNQDISIVLSAKEMDIAFSTSLAAGVTRTIRVPLQVSASHALTATLTGADGVSMTIDKWLGPILPQGPVIAIPVTDTADTALYPALNLNQKQPYESPSKPLVFQPHINSLPRTGHAYATIDALVLDMGGLSQLDTEQLQALYGHLTRCGKVLTVGIAPQLISKLRQGAGCSGAYLWSVSGFNEVADKLAFVLAATPPALPSATDLNQLAADDSNNNATYKAVVFLFAFYFIVLLMTGATTKKAWPLFLVILVTTTLALIAWWGNKPRITLVNWAEMDNGSHTVRFSALLSTEGTGIGQTDIGLPDAFGPPSPLTVSGFQYSFQDDKQQVSTRLDITSHLFSENNFYFTGTTSVVSPVAIQTNKGKLSVLNNSQNTLDSGFLSWNGQWFPVPAIPPGSRWIADLSTTLNRNSLPEKLLTKHGVEEGARLFLRFLPENLIIKDISRSVGWLSITMANRGAAP